MKEAWVILALSRLLQTQPHQGEPACTFTSLPMINVHGQQQAILVSVWGSNAPVAGRPRPVYLPIKVGSIRYPDMTAVWQDISADRVGVKTRKDEYGKDVVGDINRSHVFSVQEWLRLENEYKELLSVVLEKGWLLSGHSQVTAEEIAVARQLKQDLLILEDKVLTSYYHVVGKQFYEWLAIAAR